MPTYQYACTACDERLEVVQKFSDNPLTVCTSCGGKLRKVFSAVGIVFKGSGFYRTDSRNGSAPAGEKSGSNGSSSSESGSSSSGDKSPAEKPSGDAKAPAASASSSSSLSGDKPSSGGKTSSSSAKVA